MINIVTSTRAQALKRSIQSLCDAGVRKTTFYPLIAESLGETLDEPRQIRRAKAFAHLLDNVELAVLPFETLGGSILGMWPLAEEAPYDEQLASAFDAVEKVIASKNSEPNDKLPGGGFELRAFRRPSRFALMARDHYDANISYSSMQKIIREVQKKYEDSDEIKPHEIAKILELFFVFDYGSDVMELTRGLPLHSANHVHLDYGMVINTGYGALLQKTEGLLAAARRDGDADKVEFYTAVKISLEAAIRYIARYAKAYRAAAEDESDADRAAELINIADLLDTVSTEKASNFHEAMQLMWITHIIANTNLGSALSFGRFDQYMYPFYKVDAEAGAITEDEARELIINMILKVNEPKMRTVQSLALGGITPEGDEGSNDLTRITLEAARVVKMPYPNISLRVSEALTPEWVYEEAIETIKKGFGMPMLLNDDVWVKNFESLGYPPEYAREYYNMGCVEMMIQNRQAQWTSVRGGQINYPNFLDSILTDHYEGKLELDTFDDIMDEFVKRIKTHVENVGHEFKTQPVPEFRKHSCDPFGSALLYNCLDKGKDMHHGGTELAPFVAVGGQGLATTVDSLSSIKALVYDRKEVSLRAVTEAVHGNFAGQETLRLKLSNLAPHFGNDDDTVDSIASTLFNTATAAVHALNDGSFEERFINSYFGYTSHVSTGEITGATPNGRKAGEPLSEGVGPVQGKDTEGPTRLFNSLLKFDYRCLTGALATNCKINPSLFNTKSGNEAFSRMIRTYLRNGGPQIQVNFVRTEDLIDAQQNPDKHRDIVVRIAGFCEFFVNLDFNQQNEIIKRTEHEGA
ncbi:MAG: pyruvate formate lyase [Oscillospiraceae bacterium]|nr:pyruvate formate lyase [Oscillospiraceae bacterium]